MSVAERIHSANDARRPEGLRRKYKRMRATRAGFFRGTCHLFWEDWPRASSLNDAPPAWSCGDLHFENLGAYKGANRVAYFDINDFDEGALAPCTWDVTRFATSILVAAQDRESDAGVVLAKRFVDGYAATLAAGKATWVERETAVGPVRALLGSVSRRSRRALLREETDLEGNRRTLRIQKKKTIALTPKQRAEVFALVGTFARTQKDAQFFRPIDAAWRLAGNGSAGVERYVLLVRGKGSPDGNCLLDLKAARPTALLPYLSVRQPAWTTDAERIVAVQTRLQAVPPAHLMELRAQKKSFVLRELQPEESRLNIAGSDLRFADFETIADTMAGVIGSAHLRATGRGGSASADELIACGKTSSWKRQVLAYARDYAERVDRDWRQFTTALADGFFRDQLPAIDDQRRPAR